MVVGTTAATDDEDAGGCDGDGDGDDSKEGSVTGAAVAIAASVSLRDVDDGDKGGAAGDVVVTVGDVDGCCC